MKINVKNLKSAYEDKIVKLIAKGTRRGLYQTSGVALIGSMVFIAGIFGWGAWLSSKDDKEYETYSQKGNNIY